MIATAEAKSAELRRIAGDYVDDVMRQAEESIRTALETIQTAHSAVQNVNGGRRMPAPAPSAPQKPTERTTDENNFITLQ